MIAQEYLGHSVLLITANCQSAELRDNAFMVKSVPRTLTGDGVFVSRNRFSVQRVL